MAPLTTDSRVGAPRRGSRLRASLVCLRICVVMDSWAEAPSSRAALPAPVPSSLAARPTRSATSSRTCLRSTCLRSGTLCYPLRDFLRHLVLGRLDQVAVAQDANQATLLRHRQAADFVPLHHATRLLDVVLGTDDRHVAAHQVLGGDRKRVG